MNYDDAVKEGIDQSVHLKLALALPTMSDAERVALYKSGFGDGLQYGLREALRLWNIGAAEVKREMDQPQWLRDMMTGGRDIPNGQ